MSEFILTLVSSYSSVERKEKNVDKFVLLDGKKGEERW